MAAGRSIQPEDHPSLKQRRTSTERLVKTLLLSLVLFQRLALPLGGTQQVALVLPIILLISAIGLGRGLLRVDRTRLSLYLAAVGACTIAVVADVVRRQPWSVTSFGMLLLLYLPFVLGLADPDRAVFERSLDFFLAIMSVAAVVGIVLFVLQFVGVHYVDFLADVVPRRALVHGFQTSYPVTYGSALYKSNGVVFLEPSFFSQFLGLAVIACLCKGRRGLSIALYAVAIITTVAGTGLVMVGVGVLAFLFGPQRRVVSRVVLPAAVAVALVVMSPLASVFASRASEGSRSSSSATVRFVTSYQLVLTGWAHDPTSQTLGYGPGSTDRTISVGKTNVVASALPKLLYEYGSVATLIFSVFVGFSLLVATKSTAITASLMASYLVLNGSLLLPVIVGLCLTLSTWFAQPRAAPTPHGG